MAVCGSVNIPAQGTLCISNGLPEVAYVFYGQYVIDYKLDYNINKYTQIYILRAYTSWLETISPVQATVLGSWVERMADLGQPT